MRWTALLVCLAACGAADGTDPDAAPPDGSGPDATVPDTSGDLFNPDRILQVVITMDAADFDALRHQTRSIPDTLEGADCFSMPFDSPFSTFHANVVVDGTAYPDVGIKKKGFFGSGDGQPSFAKPALKLDANKFVAGQRFAGPGGLDKLVLNNSVQDPSYVRNCLGYEVFAAAGVITPRCNFAHVTVNDEDLGLYVHVENVDEQYIARHYGGDDSGNLYKGILSDFRPEWQGTFDLQFGAPGNADLTALTNAAAVPDDQFVAAVSAKIDLDEYLSEWAAESLLRHWDGYAGNTNNFFIYDDPATGKFDFLPWGTDQVMQNGSDNPISVYGRSQLSNRLYRDPTVQPQYLARLQQLLSTAWNESALDAEIDRMQNVIDPVRALGIDGAIADVKAFIAGRRAAIEGELANGAPAIDPNLGGPWCYAQTGHVSGTITTSYGTVNQDPWASGTGTMDVTLWGNTYTFTQYGATAGDDPNDGSHTQLVEVANEPDGHIMAIVVTFLRDRMHPGSIQIDWSPTYGVLIEYDPVANQWNQLGTLGIGHIDPSAAGTNPGDPVTVSIDADLL